MPGEELVRHAGVDSNRKSAIHIKGKTKPSLRPSHSSVCHRLSALNPGGEAQPIAAAAVSIIFSREETPLLELLECNHGHLRSPAGSAVSSGEAALQSIVSLDFPICPAFQLMTKISLKFSTTAGVAGQSVLSWVHRGIMGPKSAVWLDWRKAFNKNHRHCHLCQGPHRIFHS